MPYQYKCEPLSNEEADRLANTADSISSQTIQRIVKRVANRAHITKPVSSHVSRHTYSVTCIKKGISTRALMQLLGEPDRLSTTELYLNLSPDGRDQGV